MKAQTSKPKENPTIYETEISRGIDKWLWFVEAHTQSNVGGRDERS